MNILTVLIKASIVVGFAGLLQGLSAEEKCRETMLRSLWIVFAVSF